MQPALMHALLIALSTLARAAPYSEISEDGRQLMQPASTSYVDFGMSNKYCMCPGISSPLVQVNAYLPGARNYFLDCQYGPTGQPCEYNTAGAAVNPPSYCPAKSFISSSSGTQYCYVTCPATNGGSPLDTAQSNVVILAKGVSYTTCRYKNGSNCQFNPLTGANGNPAAGGGCPGSTQKTTGCCFTLGTGNGPSSSVSSLKASSTKQSSSSTIKASSTSASSSSSAPSSSATAGCKDHAAGDPDFVTPCSTLAGSITCPQGTPGQGVNGVVLLVHGTGSKGSESWSLSPFNVYLAKQGFDICWVDLPQRSLGDAQISAEYVAYNIPKLAAQSATKKISVIGHSQGGGLNIQWALLYWAGTRRYVVDYIALAGDFKGTTVTPLICTPETALLGGCQPSVFQQTKGSNYLQAQAVRGGQQLVTTTSIYSTSDEVVQPETGAGATSVLNGATNIALQTLCGSLYQQEHISELISPPAYAIALDALTHDGPAVLSRVDPATCLQLFTEFSNTQDVVQASLLGFAAFPDSPRVPSEPKLMPYVCAAGDADPAKCTS